MRDAHRPHHAELLRLIGTLVDNIDERGIADPQPLRVVLDGGNFKALVDGEVAECVVAVTGEIVRIMLSDVGFAMIDTVREAAADESPDAMDRAFTRVLRPK